MPAADPVAVIGMGAVGTLLAGALSAAGHPILACGRAPLRSVTVTTDAGSRSYPVTWTDEPVDVRGVRWAVLATKIHDTATAERWLSALGPGQCLLAAQNGVGHRARLAALTRAAVVPVLVYVNAERTGRGCVRARTTGRGLVMPADEPGRRAAALFSGSGLTAETAADFRTAEWEKLLSNVTANPLTALTGRRAEVLREPPASAVAMDLLQETAAVARAEGARLPERAGPDMLAWLQALPADATSSMLQDRQAGRRLEHDGLFGPVVAGGVRHRIPTPVSKTVLALLAVLPPVGPQGMP